MSLRGFVFRYFFPLKWLCSGGERLKFVNRGPICSTHILNVLFCISVFFKLKLNVHVIVSHKSLPHWWFQRKKKKKMKNVIDDGWRYTF